jgi:hypothetical protein
MAEICQRNKQHECKLDRTYPVCSKCKLCSVLMCLSTLTIVNKADLNLYCIDGPGLWFDTTFAIATATVDPCYIIYMGNITSAHNNEC